MTETFDEVNKTCKVSLNSSYVYSFVRPQAEIERKEPVTIDVRNINAQLIVNNDSAGTSIDNITTNFTTRPVTFECNDCSCEVEQSVTFNEAIDIIESGGSCECCTSGEHDIDIEEIRSEAHEFSTCSDEMYGTVKCKRCHEDVDVSLRMEVQS